MDSLCLSINDSFANDESRPCLVAGDRDSSTQIIRESNGLLSQHSVNEDLLPQQSTSCDPSALPGKIANALVLVYEGLNEFSLSEKHRRVLACLIRFGVNLNEPSRKIFIKKSSIASKVGVNEATVYRGLSALEDAGLIERDDQGSKGRATKAIATIRLTAAAITRFGFSAAPRNPGSVEKVDGRGDLAPVQDVNNAPKQSSLKKQPTRGQFCKIGGKTVPADLAWLHVENELALSGIFKLMATATKAGTKLSNVVGHCRQSLLPLKGREMFAYIASLIAQPIDFESTARRREEAAKAEEQRQQESAHFKCQVQALAAVRGHTFAGPDGRQWCVEERGFLVLSAGKSGSVPFSLARDAVTAILDRRWEACTGATEANQAGSPIRTRVTAGSDPAWTTIRGLLRRKPRA